MTWGFLPPGGLSGGRVATMLNFRTACESTLYGRGGSSQTVQAAHHFQTVLFFAKAVFWVAGPM